MKFQRFYALLKKESLQILRDPSSILIAFILPLILLFLMGYAVSLDAKHISIGIISKSNSKASQTLIYSFVGSKFFDVKLGKNKNEFMQKVQSGELKALMTLNNDFGKNYNYKVQILIDGSEPNTAGLAKKYAMGVVTSWAQRENIIQKKGIQIESRYWFNTPLSSRYFLLPGSIAVIMTLIGTLLTALVIAREWERGTMEALMATPASMIEIIIGKLVPYFILGMSSMLLCFLISYFWYHIPFEGSFIWLVILSALYLFPALSIGLFISTVAKNQFVAAQASILTGFMPVFFLSGFLFQIENMPSWLQIITYIIPARYFVEALQTLFLAGDIYQTFFKDALGIFLIGLLFFLLILKKTKRGLDE